MKAHPAWSTSLPAPLHWVLLAIALALMLFTKDQAASWADGSRLGTIQALVEHGTLALDDTDYVWQGDKVLLDGHYYSHQPPMLALIGALPYAFLHGVLGRAIDAPSTYRVLTWTLVGLPLLLGLAELARLCLAAGASPRSSALLVALAFFGTLLLPYALVLNQHGPAAGLVLLSLGLFARGRTACCGALVCLATAIDLTAVFFALALVLPAVLSGGGARNAARTTLLLALGALPVACLHLAVQYSLNASLRPLALEVEGFRYPLSPFMLMSLTGAPSVDAPGTQWAYVQGALFGQSGLFSHHPILLVCVFAGLALLWRRHSVRSSASSSVEFESGLPRGLLAAVALGAAGIASYYLVASRNFGGSSFGMRWFTVFAPTLVLFPARWLALRSAPLGWVARAALVLLSLWSCAAAALGAVQPWSKFYYRYQDSPIGMVAWQGEARPTALEHLRNEWARITTLEVHFSREQWDLSFQQLLEQHRKAYLMERPDLDAEQREAFVRQGLDKLQSVVDLLDRDNSGMFSRPVGHFYLGLFRKRLGEREAAKREFELALGLYPRYGAAFEQLQKLEAAPLEQSGEH